MTFASAVVLLFLVMDPLGNIPLFLLALKDTPRDRQTRVIVRELLIALGVLLAFLFLGGHLMRLLGLSEASLGIAGGIILLLIALRMIFPTRDFNLQQETKGEPLIVPLAIPYVAGPSALATVLLLMSREPERWPEWVAAVFLAWLSCVPIFLLSGHFRRWLGDRGLVAVERLMGLLLVTLAVELLLKGLGGFLRTV